MSVLLLAEAKSHFASVAISDDAFQMMIDDVEQEIVDRFGAYYPGPLEERIVTADDWYGPLILRRRPAAIVSIVEEIGSGSPVPTRTLEPTDYRIRGFLLDRLSAGSNPARGWSRWATTVVYVPADDTARRKMATVDVLKVELSHSGYASLRIGDYSESSSVGATGDDLPTRRTKILRRLRPARMVLR